APESSWVKKTSTPPEATHQTASVSSRGKGRWAAVRSGRLYGRSSSTRKRGSFLSARRPTPSGARLASGSAGSGDEGGDAERDLDHDDRTPRSSELLESAAPRTGRPTGPEARRRDVDGLPPRTPGAA